MAIGVCGIVATVQEVANKHFDVLLVDSSSEDPEKSSIRVLLDIDTVKQGVKELLPGSLIYIDVLEAWFEKEEPHRIHALCTPVTYPHSGRKYDPEHLPHDAPQNVKTLVDQCTVANEQ